MAHTVVMRDVPPDQLDTVTSDYQLENATVTKTQQADGNYTVTAVFPDDSSNSPAQHGSLDAAVMTFRPRSAAKAGHGHK